MNNLKNKWTTDFTIVSNVLVNCFGLHPMTRFLCVYLSAQSDAFQFNNSILCKALNCSEATLRKYMKEAIDHGLIHRERLTIAGKYGYFDYNLIDPTTLQNLPHGKKTKVEKNQGGKSVRLNKEEYLNNKELPTYLPSAGELSPEELDEILPNAKQPVFGEKEKSFAKKEKPKTLKDAESAARARLADFRKGEPAPREFQPTGSEDSHESRSDHRRRHLAFIESPEGEAEWAEIEAEAKAKANPKRCFRYACQNFNIELVCGSTQRLLSKMHNVVKIEAKKEKEIDAKISDNDAKIKNINDARKIRTAKATAAVTDQVALDAAAGAYYDHLNGTSLFGV